MTAELKKKTIITIRYVNKKFDELTYDQDISTNCVKNLKDYMLTLMEETISRYENAGKRYILENTWTAQVL